MADRGRGKANESMRDSVAPEVGRGRGRPKRVKPEEIVLESVIEARDDSKRAETEIQVEAAIQGGPDAPVTQQLGAMTAETLSMIP